MDKKNRVLVVSSDSGALESARRALDAAGIEAVGAAQAPDAAMRLKESAFDLIVVDAGLSNPSACEFLDRLRKVVPGLKRAVWEVRPRLDRERRQMLDQGQPCAVFGKTLRPEKVLAAIAHGSSAQGTAPSVQGPARPKEGREPARQADPRFELDRTAPDFTREVARILDLLIEQPDVELPVLSKVAEEVRNLVGDEDASIAKIVELVSLEPGMSARILQVANSVLYVAKSRIRNLQQALSRIGMRETRNILLAVSAKNLFSSADTRLGDTLEQLWMHSLACAYANEILARDLRIEESSDFFLMGLLHDVGKILVIRLVQEGYKRRIWTRDDIRDKTLDALLDTRHNALGARLMTRWNYDESFIHVAALHNDGRNVHTREEAVVVTYYANLLTRKVGLSLLPYPEDEDPLCASNLAQALNMSPDLQTRVEETMRATVEKIRQSYR